MKVSPRISIVIIISILIIVGILIVSYNNKPQDLSFFFIEKRVSEPSEIKLSQEKPLLEQENILPIETIPEKSISYSDAITLYGERRIQFDDECRATPASASFTVGTVVVLDNRSKSVKAIKFIDDTYAIPPLHVKLMSLDRQGIFSIDCGSSKNVSIIRVN